MRYERASVATAANAPYSPFNWIARRLPGRELNLTSRQPRYDGARELPRCGYPGDTLLTVRHAGKDHDRVVSLEIGYLAQWSISDSDRGGLKRIRWQPMPEHLKQRGRRGRE